MPGNATQPLAGTVPKPGIPKPDPILVVDDLQRAFGGLVAVDVTHLEIQRGMITALIGPNGAGKTTFFNLMTGFDSPDRGTWSYRDRDGHEADLSGRSPHHIARTGVVRTFQLPKSPNKMSVIENIKLGAPGNPGESLFRALMPFTWNDYERRSEERADELLRRFKMEHMRDEYTGTLSGGQRKLLEMARALMVDPQLLMLDEPMAGVNPALTQLLLGHIRRLRDEGVSVVFVEHDMDVVMETSDWVVCMAEGRIISEGPPQHVRSDPTVIDSYLGGDHGEKVADPEPRAQPGEVAATRDWEV